MRNSTPSKGSIVGQLHRAQIAINGFVENSDVSEVLGGYGYDSSRVFVGKALYEHVMEVHRREERERTQQYQTSAALMQAWKQAQDNYRTIRRIAQTALKGDPKAGSSLGLTSPSQRNMIRWIDQARAFYINALATPGVLDRLGVFHVPQAALESGLTEVHALEELYRRLERDRSVAQASTKARNSALKDLNRWVVDFSAISRVAFKENPEALRKLGIYIRG